eukprot:scaffold1941_cov263-Pinguiococcus_pyrenoidosus.AAC.6
MSAWKVKPSLPNCCFAGDLSGSLPVPTCGAFRSRQPSPAEERLNNDSFPDTPRVVHPPAPRPELGRLLFETSFIRASASAFATRASSAGPPTSLRRG